MNPLRDSIFRRLFTAQVLSLLGIGIMTVGLALHAYDLGGLEEAGKLLGAIFALKMVVYVVLAPLSEVVLSRFEPRRVLVSLDVIRLVVLLLLGMSSQVWHLAILTFVFYSASAAFTPLFQAMIPAILTDEKTYASGLVLSRLAYTFESMVQPHAGGTGAVVPQFGQALPSGSDFPGGLGPGADVQWFAGIGFGHEKATVYRTADSRYDHLLSHAAFARLVYPEPRAVLRIGLGAGQYRRLRRLAVRQQRLLHLADGSLWCWGGSGCAVGSQATVSI